MVTLPLQGLHLTPSVALSFPWNWKLPSPASEALPARSFSHQDRHQALAPGPVPSRLVPPVLESFPFAGSFISTVTRLKSRVLKTDGTQKCRECYT